MELKYLERLCIISIHAPREGGDGNKYAGIDMNEAISIHAPREGGDC